MVNESEFKISVVIPAYNAENFIENTLNSIYCQTEPVFEVIVIDDGSVDETFNTVNNYIKKNSIDNLKLFVQKNSGPSVARNKGVSEAKGNWISFLDADDEWLPKKIEIQKKILIDNPENKLISTLRFGDKKSTDRIQKVSFKKCLFRNYFFTSSVMIEKNVFMKYKFDTKQKYSEDYKLFLEVVKNFSAILVNEGLVKYNSDTQIRSNSLSSKLWLMEKGELSNYRYLLKKNYINLIQYIFFSSLSLLKFLRRIVVKKLK